MMNGRVVRKEGGGEGESGRGQRGEELARDGEEEAGRVDRTEGSGGG